MAITTTEGMLEIDLADVYIWLSKEGYTNDATVESMKFSVEEDALVLHRKGKERVHVDAAALWTWVIDHQLPAGLAAHETVFGVPTVAANEHLLRITFASSSESDPRSWARPPACLAEWTRHVEAHKGRARPPHGYASWLDFAVASMDVRSAQLAKMAEGPVPVPTHEAMREWAKAELVALQAESRLVPAIG